MSLRIATAFLSAAALIAAPQESDQQLEAAIHTEMVKGDLKSAIAQYRKILAQSGKPRNVAARALYQLGQCQEKLGQAEARQSYQRLVKEYADTEFAAKARLKLAVAEPQPTRNPIRPARVDKRCGIPSEDGRLVVCQIDTALIIRDLASGQDRPILERPANRFFRGAELSPDGKQVVYVLSPGYVALTPQIRIVNSDGSGDRLLYDQAGVEAAWLESWSADSRQILAGVRVVPSGDYKMVLLSAADNSARILSLDVVEPPPPGPGRTPFMAYLSPDSKYVAYRSRPNRAPVIYVAPVAGGKAHALFDWKAPNGPRGWMKDGRLVFVSNRNGTQDLWSIRMTDGKPVGEPEPFYHGLDSNAYTGRMDYKGSYYYWSTVSSVKRDVFNADLDSVSANAGKQPAPVSTRYVGMSKAPAYSHDGRFLAYASSFSPEKIYIRNLDAGGERVLNWQGRYISRLVWYPDGSALLVYGFRNGAAPGFFRLDLKSSQITDVLTKGVTNDGATNPSFSPDGRYIYFKYFKTPREENSCVVRFDLQTFRQEDVFCPGSERLLRLFALSPDGTRLAFGGRNSENMDHIGVVPVSGGEPKVVFRYELKRGMRAWSGLAWTADGKKILYHKDPPGGGGSDDIWLLSPDDGSSKKLLSTWVIYSMAVHPNGKEIAWDAQTGGNETEMWVMENLLPPLP